MVQGIDREKRQSRIGNAIARTFSFRPEGPNNLGANALRFLLPIGSQVHDRMDIESRSNIPSFTAGLGYGADLGILWLLLEAGPLTAAAHGLIGPEAIGTLALTKIGINFVTNLVPNLFQAPLK